MELTGARAIAAQRRRSIVVGGVEVDEELRLLRLHEAQVRLLGRVRLRRRDARLEEHVLVLELAAAALFGLLQLPRRPLQDDALKVILLPRGEVVLGADHATRRRVGLEL